MRVKVLSDTITGNSRKMDKNQGKQGSWRNEQNKKKFVSTTDQSFKS
jgi:hypothetical protein